MQKTIDVVYEDGVFKPLKKVKMPEHSKLKMIVSQQEGKNNELIARKQCDALLSISGIGSSGLKDVSENPERYLYGIRKK